MNPDIIPSQQPPVPEEPEPQVYQPVVMQHHRRGYKSLVELLVVFLLVGAAIGGYWYGHTYKPPKQQAAVPVAAAAKPAPPTQAKPVHFVLSEGYPYDAGAKDKVTVKLGVPGFMQAASTLSTIQKPGLTEYFTDKFNDEMGRFILGNPDDPNDNKGGDSEISVLAISKSWLAANNKDEAADILQIVGAPLKTPADKRQYIATLKTDTAACAKDPAKGFTTTDGVLNICYTTNFGREGYSPMLLLRGYAEVKGQPYVLKGLVNIYDSIKFATPEASKQAAADANNGKLTAEVKQKIAEAVAAFKQTTLTVSANSAVNR